MIQVADLVGSVLGQAHTIILKLQCLEDGALVLVKLTEPTLLTRRNVQVRELFVPYASLAVVASTLGQPC